VDFFQTVTESKEVSAEDFVRLVQDASQSIRSEQGRFGNLLITEKLVKLDPVGEVLVIGDLHGNLDGFASILERSKYIHKLDSNKSQTIVFLGDYGDRGTQSPELYYCLLRLKLAFPKQVVLLRGNHEGPSDLLASPHDLPTQLQRRFGHKWVPVYSNLRALFDDLYNAVYVEGRYLMLHGGLPAKIRSLQEIAEADRLHPQKSFLEEILWSDPEERIQGTTPSPRGAGNLFGSRITQEVLNRLNARILIRGHEATEKGYKINHEGKILTLFSLKGPPYFNSHGAYLELPLAEKFENANQLIPYIHKL